MGLCLHFKNVIHAHTKYVRRTQLRCMTVMRYKICMCKLIYDGSSRSQNNGRIRSEWEFTWMFAPAGIVLVASLGSKIVKTSQPSS
jgi:hypothetical protein